MANKKEEAEILKLAVKNALDYGQAREGHVIKGILSKYPEGGI